MLIRIAKAESLNEVQNRSENCAESQWSFTMSRREEMKIILIALNVKHEAILVLKSIQMT